MDGNRRWATAHNKSEFHGHRAGSQALKQAINYCLDHAIRYLSAYVFSTENWRRPESQTTKLMHLFNQLLHNHSNEAVDNRIQIRCIGNLSGLPRFIQDTIGQAHAKPVENPKLTVNLMINYGSQDELVQAVQMIVSQHVEPASVSTQLIADHLYTAGLPDPDILIRTGGAMRLSNFMLWQCAYTELFFLPVLWPDFTDNTLHDVITTYQTRSRNFGE